MSILYIGYYTSEELLYEIQRRKINNMSVARQKYEENLLSGIIKDNKYDDIRIVSYVPTDGTIPIPNSSELAGKKVLHFPINRRNFWSVLMARKSFSDYLKSLGESVLQNLRVVMYEVNPVFLGPLLSLKRKYNIKIITLCAELSIFRRSKKIKYQIRNRIFAHYERKFDAFVLFARPMEEVLKCQKKPNIVVEGIAPEIFGPPKEKRKNIVMYAGGLGSDNNIKLLIDVCLSTNELDELWICGVGTDREYVESVAKTNSKVKYLGAISNEKVRELEKEAKLLVNLRQPTAQITRYSFPSKLLEYMASGSLVLSTKLEGIPKEYFDYILTVDSLSEDDVKTVIRNVFAMSTTEYIDKVKKSQEFIGNTKNKCIQSGKILKFIESV